MQQQKQYQHDHSMKKILRFKKNINSGTEKGIVHGIGTKLVSNWEQNILYTKILQILCRKRIFMLTGLKTSFVAGKYVFYRSKHNAKGEPHGIGF